MPGDVLLLRSPSEDTTGPDKYVTAFRARGYHALSIPVLETVFTNANDLVSVVRAGGRISKDGQNPAERYAGVIVTSGRACEAWQAAVQKLADTDSLSGTEASKQGEGWSTIPFYAVGQATASALSAIHSTFPSSPYAPHDVRGAAESGTAEKLAHFIVSDLPTSAGRRLLYLTGDKNRDVLPTILAEAHFELDNLQLYATQGSSHFEDDLKNALDGVQALDPDRTEHWWIVHFAPSSAKHVFPVLRTQFDIPTIGDTEKAAARRRARIAAIGPTTSKFLEEELKVKVDVVPTKPTPEALVADIARWDSNSGF